ncbi:MAG: 5'-nucleotidase C-terminal domain-containing protein [Polyangiales bacterium]
MNDRLGKRWLVGGVVSALVGASGVAAAQPARPGVARPGARPAAQTAPAAPACPDCPTCPPPPPPPPAPPTPLVVSVSAAINGSYADVTCSQGDRGPVSLSTVAGQFAGEAGALRIDAGDLVGNAAVSRLTVEHDAAGLAAAVNAMGYRALAVGHRDIAGHRAAFLSAAQAITAQGGRYVLSNLRCEGEGQSLCATVQDANDPPVILEHAGQRVAIVALVAPSALTDAAADHRTGLTLDPLDEAITREVAEARAAGATRVIVTLDPTSSSSMDDALSLANSFEPGAGPDAMIVHSLANGLRSLRADRSGTLLVAARDGGSMAVDLTDGAHARPSAVGAPPAPVASYVESTTRWLCSSYGSTLPGGRLSRPMSQADFANYALDVARDVTRSEVALINRRAVKMPSLFPLQTGISALTIQSALPFLDTLQVARVTGAKLKAFITAGRSAGFYVRGLEVRNGSVFVNGRAIDDAQNYSVVTTGFVAEAGADGVGAEVAWAREGTESLQSLLTAWLQSAGPDGNARVPTDPANEARWQFRWTVDGQFSNTTIDNANTTLYSDAQLTRAQAVALRVDSEARADAEHPAYTWLNGLRIRYGAQETIATGGASTGFVENLDLIALTTKFTWRYFRNNRRWYHPLPFIEGYVESEFDLPPADANGVVPRDFHHLQVRPTAGATFELLPRMTLDLGAGADWAELFAPSGDARRSGQFNMLGRLVLRPGTLFTLGDRPIDGGFNVEVAFRDPAGTQDLILRAGLRLSVPLFAPLKLTFGYDLYGRQVFSPRDAMGNEFASPGFALSGDATIGLTLQFAGARQIW